MQEYNLPCKSTIYHVTLLDHLKWRDTCDGCKNLSLCVDVCILHEWIIIIIFTAVYIATTKMTSVYVFINWMLYSPPKHLTNALIYVGILPPLVMVTSGDRWPSLRVHCDGWTPEVICGNVPPQLRGLDLSAWSMQNMHHCCTSLSLSLSVYLCIALWVKHTCCCNTHFAQNP